ncbi:MAG: cation transporter dimerization domain-containing protein [Tistlia sp.]
MQLHLEVDGGMKLYRAHAIAEAVEAELQTAFPHAEVTIHQDPYVLSEDTPVYS